MDTDPMPKLRIDVVMPLYNKAEFVEAAIRSVLAQNALHQLFVVDDGSTDAGPARVAALAREYPAIRLLHQPNAGVSAARNRGIRSSLADYVAFLDADDLYVPGFLEQIADMAVCHPDAALLGTAYRRFSGDAAIALAEAENRAQKDGSAAQRVPAFFERWSRDCFFLTSSVAARRQALLDLGTLFPEGECLGEDQDVWFRLAERHDVVWSPRELALYRVEVANSLTASNTVQAVLPCYVRLADRVASPAYPRQHLRGARRVLAVNYLNTARNLLRLGRRREAAVLTFTRRALRHPTYWLRTVVRCVLPVGGQR